MDKLLSASKALVKYVNANMGESCQCMFCGHHHIHTDETNMQERYEKKVCPFVEFERVVTEAAQHNVQADLLPCGHSVDNLGNFGGCNPMGSCVICDRQKDNNV